MDHLRDLIRKGRVEKPPEQFLNEAPSSLKDSAFTLQDKFQQLKRNEIIGSTSFSEALSAPPTPGPSLSIHFKRYLLLLFLGRSSE